MTTKRYISNGQMQTGVLGIVTQMYHDNWRPDYIVGVTRGGLIPAVLMSHYTGIKMHTLDVRLRDADHGPESNGWMSEDAFGYVSVTDRDDVWSKATSDPSKRKKILILDDINDTGATFNWIKNDWRSGCMPDDESWKDVWNNNVRFAAIIDNVPSEFELDYTSIEINKAEDPAWIVFPFEEWW
jgi:xanthine phosphoribosyltransferase